MLPAIAASICASLGLPTSDSRAAGRHDLPWLAIAALRDLEREPSILQRAPMRCRADPLDRRNTAICDRADTRHTRPHGFAVNMRRTSPALGDPATEFGSGQSNDIAKDPQ
jgi:hypothetical protein